MGNERATTKEEEKKEMLLDRVIKTIKYNINLGRSIANDIFIKQNGKQKG